MFNPLTKGESLVIITIYGHMGYIEIALMFNALTKGRLYREVTCVL
jgi:hypothetical protein